MPNYHASTEHDAAILWDYVAVHDGPFKCQTKNGLAMSDAQIRRLSKYLLHETGQQVILPTGSSPEPHQDPFDSPCQCGRLLLGYNGVTAKRWYHRRLTIALGHAISVFETGENIAMQFPESNILFRLTTDASRVKEDIEMALAWMGDDDTL